MKLNSGLFDEDQIQESSVEHNSPNTYANFDLRLSNLPSFETPPEAFPYISGRDLILNKLSEIEAWDRFCLEGNITSSVYSVGRSILAVERQVLEALYNDNPDQLTTKEDNSIQMAATADRIFHNKSYSEKLGISEEEWKISCKPNDNALALYRSISQTRAVFEGHIEAKIGGNFHDRVSVLLGIMSMAAGSNRIMAEWVSTNNFRIGHEIVMERHLRCRRIIGELKITEAERNGFLSYIDELCPHIGQ